jgi:hypothetical protein
MSIRHHLATALTRLAHALAPAPRPPAPDALDAAADRAVSQRVTDYAARHGLARATVYRRIRNGSLSLPAPLSTASGVSPQ